MKYQKSGRFEQTDEFQQMYQRLLAVCDEQGTMVSQDRTLENDKDIAPYKFFRKGTRDYVFPQQQVSLKSDNPEVITPQEGYAGYPETAGYGLRWEVQTFAFDESKVKGRLKIKYHDAGNNPAFSVETQENSELPEPVKKTLEDLF